MRHAQRPACGSCQTCGRPDRAHRSLQNRRRFRTAPTRLIIVSLRRTTKTKTLRFVGHPPTDSAEEANSLPDADRGAFFSHARDKPPRSPPKLPRSTAKAGPRRRRRARSCYQSTFCKLFKSRNDSSTRRSDDIPLQAASNSQNRFGFHAPPSVVTSAPRNPRLIPKRSPFLRSVLLVEPREGRRPAVA